MCWLNAWIAAQEAGFNSWHRHYYLRDWCLPLPSHHMTEIILNQHMQILYNVTNIRSFSCSNHFAVPSSTEFTVIRVIPGPIT